MTIATARQRILLIHYRMHRRDILVIEFLLVF